MTGEPEDTGIQELPDDNASAAAAAAASAEADATRRATEAEALKVGWADRAHWRGKPEDFIEADEFLHMANRHLPIVNARLKTVNEQLEAERAERKRLDTQYAAQIADLKRSQQESEERRLAQEAEMDRQFRAHNAAHVKMMDLQRRNLVEAMDLEKRKALMIEDPASRAAAYDAVNQREQAAIRNLMEAERPAEVPPPAPKPAAPPQPSAQAPYAPEAQTRADAWLAKNAWLRDNPDLMRAAGQIEIPRIPSLDFNTNPEGHLDYIKTKMKSWGIPIPGEGDSVTNDPPAVHTPAASPPAAAQTPPAAPPPAAPRGSPVEGASRRGVTPAPKEKGYKELPPSAKAACEELIKHGRFKGDLEMHRKGYAAEYWEAYSDE